MIVDVPGSAVADPPPDLFGAPAPPARSASGQASMPYFPALEGLRGLAVAVVLLFHAGLTPAQGGFLGVSTFFTLSGFLITALLLTERGATGTIDLRRFWVRRVRRLMPASLAALALVTLYGLLAADAVQRRNLGGDVLAALGYAANWRFLLSEQSYADVLGHPSPVLHFWSLAIEEQFYVVFPFLCWLALTRLRLRRAGFGALLGGLAVASVAVSVSGRFSADAIYYGTGARAAELLVGGVLATVLFDRRVTHRLATNRSTQAVVGSIGAGALAVCVFLWITVPQSAGWLYRGGFAGYSLLTAAVILAAVTPWGPVRALLSARPWRALGTISYGLYLYHWPVFQWLDAGRVGLPAPVLLAVQLAVTGVLTVASFHLLETPIRHRRGLALRLPLSRLAPVVMVGVSIAVLAVSITAPRPVIDFDLATRELTSVTGAAPAHPLDTKSTEAPFPRMAVFGDSTALLTGMGLVEWAETTGKAEFVEGSAKLGCGIGRGGERRDATSSGPVANECSRWALSFKQKVEDHEPNIAVVQIGPWEVADRKLEGDTQWRSVGDPVYDNFLRGEMDLAVDTLAAHGAVVVWLTSPPLGFDSLSGRDSVSVRGEPGRPERMARMNELIRELPQRRAGKVQILDLAGWLAGTGEDGRLRPDGVHFSLTTSPEVAARFLGDAVLDTYRRSWVARAEALRGEGGEPAGTTPLRLDPYLDQRRKILVVGDDNARLIGDALKAWGAQNNALDVTVLATANCGALRSAERDDRGRRVPTPAECGSVGGRWIRDAAAGQPDMVVIVPSVWDLTEQRVEPGGPFATWGDAGFERQANAQYLAIVDGLRAARVPIGWLNFPATFGKERTAPATPLAALAPARLAAYDRELQALLPFVGLKKEYQRFDFARYAERWTGSTPLLTAAGELNPAAAATVAAWLGPEVFVRYDDYLAAGNTLHR